MILKYLANLKINTPIFVVILIITFLALCIRLFYIQTPQLWYDEAYTALQVRSTWTYLFSSIKADVHPPVYFILLKSFTDVFGTSEYTLRAPSALFGALLVPLSYYFIGIIFSKLAEKYKLLFISIVAINPFYIEYSRDARPYTLALLLYVLTATIFYKAINQKVRKLNAYWFAFGAASFLTFLTHYVGAIGVALLIVYDLFINFGNTKFFLKKLKVYLISGGLFLLGLFYYVYKVLLYQYHNAPFQWWIPITNISKVTDIVYGFLFGVKSKQLGVPTYIENLFSITPTNLGFLFFMVMVIILMFYYKSLTKKTKSTVTFLLFTCFVPIFIALMLQLVGLRLIVERYLIQFSYGVLALVFFSFHRIKKGVLVIFFIAYLANFLLYFYKLPSSYTDNYAKDLKEYYEGESNPNLTLVFDDPIDFIIAKYYFTEDSNVDIKLDNFFNKTNKYEGWNLIAESDLIKTYADLGSGHRAFVYKNRGNVRDVWYRDSYEVDGRLVLTTIPRENYIAGKYTL